MSKVIDFRVRPPYGTYQNFVNLIGPAQVEAYGFEYRGSLASKSYDDFVAELDASGVERAVIQGRHGGFGLNVSNQELFDLVEQDPNRYIAYPFIEALAPDAIEQIDELIVNGPGRGAALEPGLPTAEYPAFDFDDRRVYPVYEKLQAEHIPILLTYSALALNPATADSARQLDQVALDFPDLVIVVAHAGWPWTLENIAIAYRRPNIYLSPDMYGTRGPGSDDYKIAARTILRDKIIFGSSYPIIPIDQTVELVKTEWGLDDETLEKVLYGNAARVLGL